MFGTKLSVVVLFCVGFVSLTALVSVVRIEPTSEPLVKDTGQLAMSRIGAEKAKVSKDAEQEVHRPDNMFPNEYDSGSDDSCSHIPPTYFHLLSIPFHNSGRLPGMYCPERCFVGPVVGDWCGYGMQFLDRCRNNQIRMAVYDPSKRTATYLGVLRECHGSNYGGIFMPMALTRDDSNIILEAWMGSPGAGGGLVNYGYALMPIKAATYDTTSPSLTVIAPRGALFYDDYEQVVDLGNSDNMLQYPQLGPSQNSGALFFRDLVTGKKSKILEAENATYELQGIDTVGATTSLKAIKYEFSDTCPKDENGYFCAKKNHLVTNHPATLMFRLSYTTRRSSGRFLRIPHAINTA